MSDVVDDSSMTGSSDTIGIGPFPIDPSQESQIITARGTEDGLTLRIDGRAAWEAIVSEIELFLGGRRKFFEGGELLIEWLDRLPTKEQSKNLQELLKSEYGIEIVTRKKRIIPKIIHSSEKPLSETNTKATAIPLFDQIETTKKPMRDNFPPEGIEKLSDPTFSIEGTKSTNEIGKRYVDQMAKILGEELLFEEDANAKLHFGTLRSGQKLETPFSLIVIGDVNPGADLIAGGDIIVIGHLRGTAHASAYDDDAFDKVIVATKMQPMQLRIGPVISRGSDDSGKGPEMARIENRRIVVDTFNSRDFSKKSLGKKA